MNRCEECMIRQPQERRDKHFNDYINRMYSDRNFTREELKMAKEFFYVGYTSCKEDVSRL